MAMSELGAYLRRHREEQGLSLEEIEEQTRIRRPYLEAIEAGEWDRLPPGVYTRGLLKSYARALGVSKNSVMRMYAKERPGEARLPEPQLISQPLLRETRFSFEILLAATVLVVALSLFAWTVVRSPALESIWQGGGDAGEGGGAPVTESEAGADPTAIDVEAIAEGATATAIPKMTVAPVREETATPRPSPTPSGLLAVIDVSSDVWLEVRLDDEEPVAGFLRPGDDPVRYQAKERIVVKTGNAGPMEMEINGQAVGSLGEAGEVRTYEWRLLEDGLIEQLELP